MGAKVVTHLHWDFRQNSHVPSETSGLKGNCDWTWFNFQGEHINLWQLFIHLEKKSLSRNCTLQSQLEDKAWRRQANKQRGVNINYRRISALKISCWEVRTHFRSKVFFQDCLSIPWFHLITVLVCDLINKEKQRWTLLRWKKSVCARAHTTKRGGD